MKIEVLALCFVLIQTIEKLEGQNNLKSFLLDDPIVQDKNNQEPSPSTCDLGKLQFSYKPQTSFSDYFFKMKNYMTKLSLNEMESIYKFLDSKTTGSFSSNRWTHFEQLFLIPFTKYDTDNDCLLSQAELLNCLKESKTDNVLKFANVPFDDVSLVTEIIYSLDTNRNGGLNLEGYLLLKRTIIGFRQYNVQGSLNKDGFDSAIKLTFADKTLSEIDTEMGYKLALSLMGKQIANNSLNFIQYFEICRIVNVYLSYGVLIGEGYVTKDQITNRFNTGKFGSKLEYKMITDFFDSYIIEGDAQQKVSQDKLQPEILRFEDHGNLEFWANIYSNYNTPSFNLNQIGFVNLIESNKYIIDEYLLYVKQSNFEEANKVFDKTVNITDYDFLTNLRASFIEKETTVSNFIKSGIKTKAKFKTKSLYDMKFNLDPNNNSNKQNDENTLLKTNLNFYFAMLDTNNDGNINFSEFLTFIKFLNLFKNLNSKSITDGILSSNKVNCKIKFLH